MKMRNKVLIGVGIFTAVIVAAVGGYLFYQYQQFEQKLFLNHSTLNGLDVSCMSVDRAYDIVYEDSKSKKITLKSGDILADLELSDFCEITFDKEAIQRGMDEITFSDFLQGKSREYEAECAVTMNREQAVSCIKEILSGIPQEKSSNARIEKTEDGFTLVDEVYGTVVNRKKLMNKIESSIEEIAKNEITTIDLEEFYKKPKVKTGDLEKDYEKLQEYLAWSVTWKGCDVELGREDMFPYIEYNNKTHEIMIDDTFLRDKVYVLSQAVNTVGKTRNFKATSYEKASKKAHSGKTIQVSGGTYGRIVNREAEYSKLAELMKKCKSQKGRKPIWLLEPQSDGRDDIGDTYIEISIDRQHLWYYVDGELKMQTDIVTGMKGLHDTPTGTYYITERINGKYLTGDDYKTWVNKWMRLTNMGIGLHDATWKSSFGGSIYTYSGSHGCINLPYSFACDLFDAVYVGLPVVVYDNQ